ncbi:protein of unknown function [Paraburkholderia dioscoreae]|uniref:Uncharacterized protein n=1 Tax=Paraburkholderia dioscoreae TaxID=2604047 RepID=A0A5Q4ZHC3_9BURK|nr:protein of unknown function [Paraburkholderia dioscoreae]
MICEWRPPTGANLHLAVEKVPRRRAERRRMYDGLVTVAECARTRIPDGPLPGLCEGSA